MKEYNFQRDLVDGATKVEVGQCLTNRKLGRLRVIRACDPYMVDGDSDDDAGRSGGGFRAGRRFMRQDYVCVQEGEEV